MNFSEFWTHIQVRKWGKYVVTIVVFLIVYLFVGDQSVLQSWRRQREINRLEEQRDMYRAGAEKAQQEIRMLQNTDSLERYARETYYMHALDEDIYLVEE